MYTYPLKLSFHLIALAPRVSIQDATSKEIFYIEQKAFKLKEEITIYRNNTKEEALFHIKTKQIIDFGAEYFFTDAQTNKELGSLQQEGLRSVIKATYFLKDEKGATVYTLFEANPWVKLFDFLVDMVPFVQLVSGYFFHSKYIAEDVVTKKPVMSLTKKPSFFESSFEIALMDKQVGNTEELRILLACIMLILLERNRG